MALFDGRTLRAKYFGESQLIVESRSFSETTQYRTGKQRALKALEEISRGFSTAKKYDVFLAHSKRDEVTIYQLYLELLSRGYRPYVDWINDPLLDRTKVSPATANVLRERIRACDTLLMAYSSNSVQSFWVQWELGYGDGAKGGRVAILPIEEAGAQANFHRQEYLGLYPHVDIVDVSLYVNGTANKSKSFANWLTTTNPRELIT